MWCGNCNVGMAHDDRSLVEDVFQAARGTHPYSGLYCNPYVWCEPSSVYRSLLKEFKSIAQRRESGCRFQGKTFCRCLDKLVYEDLITLVKII